MRKTVAKVLPIWFGRKVFYVQAELALQYYRLSECGPALAKKKMQLLKEWGVWEHKAPTRIEPQSSKGRYRFHDESCRSERVD